MSSGRIAGVVEKLILKVDVAVRRRSRLGEHPRLRKLLLGPYRWFLNLHGRGVLMNIAGCIPARMPPDFAWKLVEDYEKESLAVFNRWMRSQQNPLVVDVGCALGFVTCAGLFSNPTARVIAIDSDLQSVKATQRVCALAPGVGERLALVWGFIADAPSQRQDYRAVHQTTLQALQRPGISGDPNSTHYTCLDTEGVGQTAIPRFALDDLLGPEFSKSEPVLIKCDVEGAELLVLKSAQRVLSELRPALLLSVHPQFLPNYGMTPEDVRAFLTARGYVIEVVAVDHEEHWWCVPATIR